MLLECLCSCGLSVPARDVALLHFFCGVCGITTILSHMLPTYMWYTNVYILQLLELQHCELSMDGGMMLHILCSVPQRLTYDI